MQAMQSYSRSPSPSLPSPSFLIETRWRTRARRTSAPGCCLLEIRWDSMYVPGRSRCAAGKCRLLLDLVFVPPCVRLRDVHTYRTLRRILTSFSAQNFIHRSRSSHIVRPSSPNLSLHPLTWINLTNSRTLTRTQTIRPHILLNIPEQTADDPRHRLRGLHRARARRSRDLPRSPPHTRPPPRPRARVPVRPVLGQPHHEHRLLLGLGRVRVREERRGRERVHRIAIAAAAAEPCD